MVTTNSKFEMDNNSTENVSPYEDKDHNLDFYGQTKP